MGSLVSYIPKNNKNVLLISSLHHDDKIDLATGNLQKPSIFADYNTIEGG